jgi:hypothetical protein
MPVRCGSTRPTRPDPVTQMHLRRQRIPTRHGRHAPTALVLLLLASAPAWAGIKAALWADSVVHLHSIDSMGVSWSGAEPAHHEVGAKPTADTDCASAHPTFRPEIEQLGQAIGDDAVGQARECSRLDAASGDRVAGHVDGSGRILREQRQRDVHGWLPHRALEGKGLKYWRRRLSRAWLLVPDTSGSPALTTGRLEAGVVSARAAGTQQRFGGP